MKILLAMPAMSLSGISGTFDSIQLGAQMALNNLQVNTEKGAVIFMATLQWQETALPLRGTVIIKPQAGGGSSNVGSVDIALNLTSPLPIAGNIVIAPQIANEMLLVDVLELTLSSPSMSSTRLPATLQRQITTAINAGLNRALAGKVRFTQLKIDADVRVGLVLNENMGLTLIIKP